MSDKANPDMPIPSDNYESKEKIVNGKHIVKVLYESNDIEIPSVIYARYIDYHNVDTLKATMDTMVKALDSLATPTYVIVNFEGVDMVANSLMNVREHPVYAHPKAKIGMVYGMNIAVRFQNELVANSAVKSGEKVKATPRYYDNIEHVVSELPKDFPDQIRSEILEEVYRIENNLRNNKE
jgi:hypothetical protein